MFQAVKIGCLGKTPDMRCCGVYGKLLQLPDTASLLKGMNRPKQDIKKALELFDTGCSQEEPQCCLLAVKYYMSVQNTKKALEYAERACDKCSNPKGCHIAAQIHYQGDSKNSVAVNKDKYTEYSEKMKKLLPVKSMESMYVQK